MRGVLEIVDGRCSAALALYPQCREHFYRCSAGLSVTECAYAPRGRLKKKRINIAISTENPPAAIIKGIFRFGSPGCLVTSLDVCAFRFSLPLDSCWGESSPSRMA